MTAAAIAAEKSPGRETAPGLTRVLIADGKLRLDEPIRIPGWVLDLVTFRRWARSVKFPKSGKFTYLAGELWIDLSMEEIFDHGQVKTELTVVLGSLVRSQASGYLNTDATRISNPAADLSSEPDLVYVSKEAVLASRVRLVEGAEGGYLEWEGAPDMVLEIVSPGSVEKDTIHLRYAYFQAGVTEYWLIDARDADLRFTIFRRGRRGYTATRPRSGWLRSAVFDRSFRLSRETDSLGFAQFKLEVRA